MSTSTSAAGGLVGVDHEVAILVQSVEQLGRHAAHQEQLVEAGQWAVPRGVGRVGLIVDVLFGAELARRGVLVEPIENRIGHGRRHSRQSEQSVAGLVLGARGQQHVEVELRGFVLEAVADAGVFSVDLGRRKDREPAAVELAGLIVGGKALHLRGIACQAALLLNVGGRQGQRDLEILDGRLRQVRGLRDAAVPADGAELGLHELKVRARAQGEDGDDDEDQEQNAAARVLAARRGRAPLARRG